MDYTKIALCICTRNRPDDVQKALASVWKSSLLPVQVIVSDDSDEAQSVKTKVVCEAQPHLVHYVVGPRQGLSWNRNNCIKNLQEGIAAVSFIDDDVEITPEFLAGAAAAMAKENGKSLVTGRENKNGYLVEPQNRSFWGHQQVRPAGPDDYHAIVINTTLFPRSLFDTARFDEMLRYGCEEVDMAGQARSLGYGIRYVPELLNFHYPSPVNREEYKAQLEVSRFYAQYKYYRWVLKDNDKARKYVMLAPFHRIAGVLRAGKWQQIPAVMNSINRAKTCIREAAQARGEQF